MKKRLAFVVTVLFIGGIVAGGHSYAQDTTLNSDVLLQGQILESNKEYRDRLYLQKSFDVDSIPAITTEDRAEATVNHSNLDIDKKFGVDFPLEKREQLNTAQRAMLAEKIVIDDLYKSGAITLDEYMERAANAVEVSLFSAAEILSNEEFALLFGIDKSQIKGSFYSATQYTPAIEK